MTFSYVSAILDGNDHYSFSYKPTHYSHFFWLENNVLYYYYYIYFTGKVVKKSSKEDFLICTTSSNSKWCRLFITMKGICYVVEKSLDIYVQCGLLSIAVSYSGLMLNINTKIS